MTKKLGWYQRQEEYWDKIARQFEREKKLPLPARIEQEEFFRFLALSKKAKILEIGCGTGRWTLPLLRRGHQIWATEISQISLEKVKKLAEKEGVGKSLFLKKTSFEKEEFRNKFDFVLFMGVIHHLDPQKKEKIFRNAVTALKSGGYLVALEPNPLNPLFHLYYFWRWLNNTQGKNRWETEKGFLFSWAGNLKKLFKKGGLVEITIKRFALFPTRFAERWLPVLQINKFLLALPVVDNFSAFIWIKGKKK